MAKGAKGGNSKHDSDRKSNELTGAISKKKAPIDHLSFGKKLAAVDKPTRDRGVKNLSKWMISRESMTEVDFMKIWKGLYYCYWLSDKPIVQYELADQLSDLVLQLNDEEKPYLFLKSFYSTLKREWSGIDYLRINKYLKFVRQMLNKSLEFLKRKEWNEESIKKYNEILPIHPDATEIGLQMHLIQIYLEEINRVGGNDLDSFVVSKLLDPFLPILQSTINAVLLKAVVKLFNDLLEHYKQGRERTEYDPEEGDLPYLRYPWTSLMPDLIQITSSKETPPKNRKECYALKETVEARIKEEREEEEAKKAKKVDKKRKVPEKVEEKEKEAPKTKKVALKKKSATKEVEEEEKAVKKPVLKKKLAKEPEKDEEEEKEVVKKPALKKKSAPKEAKKEEEEKKSSAPLKKKTSAKPTEEKEEKPSAVEEKKPALKKKTSSKANGKEEEVAVPADKLLQELEHKVIPLDEVEKKRELEEHPKQKSNGKAKKEAEVEPVTPKKKSLIWDLTKNKSQEFEDASNIHPVSPAVRNKNRTAKPILRSPAPMKPNMEIKVPEPKPKPRFSPRPTGRRR